MNSARPGAASRRDLVLAGVVTGLFIATSVALELSERVLAWTQPWERYQLDELPGALLFLAVALSWFSWRRAREARAELAQRVAAQERLAEALAENRRLSLSHVLVQEQERKELARELHDELGQHLNAIKINAVSIRNRTTDVHAAAREIVDVTDHVHGTIRDMLRRLRPVGLDELGLTAALEHVVQGWNARHPDVRARLQIDTDIDSMREQQNLAVYRLVQEALNNVSRHAQARKVAIQLAGSGASGAGLSGADNVVVTIFDDGVGMPGREDGAAGQGLIGMRERIEALRGSLAVEAGAGAGFRITATIPRAIERSA